MFFYLEYFNVRNAIFYFQYMIPEVHPLVWYTE